MATTTTTTTQPKVGKRLVILFILIVALIASLAIGSVTTGKSRWSPDFALDLEGGTQIILTPVLTDSSKTITQEDINQAIEIIRQRVDASGVAEAEITSEGGNNIIVSLPGTPSQETLDLVRTSAVLRMRPVLQVDGPTALSPETVTAEGAENTEGATDPSNTIEITDQDGNTVDLNQQGENPTAEATAYTPEELEAEAKKKADTNGDGTISDTPAAKPENTSDPAWLTEQVLYESYMLDCTQPDARISAAEDDPDKPFVACSSEGFGKYILGPAEVDGSNITNAVSGYNQERGLQVVNLRFDNAGDKKFSEVTGRIYQLEEPRNQFAIVLDGQVISAPVPNGPISGGAEISGDFTVESAKALANQLSFGSLPLHFDVQSEEQISPTLGAESLRAGLIAGLIGIILIVLYLLWQYHGLGVIAIGSVTLAIGLSYFVVSLLSWTMGMRLSLAGVVALIISIGITADSFIVFFERIRDEQREGRSNVAAVARGWERAKRTVIVADSVNLLAAVVLYFLAIGSVRGFAFTLGLTTFLDLIIVLMFTYPVMTLLVRKTAFFGEGKRFSGMDSVALGNKESVYKGAGRFTSSKKDSGDGLSLAERRARERREKQEEAKEVADSAVDVEETQGKENS